MNNIEMAALALFTIRHGGTLEHIRDMAKVLVQVLDDENTIRKANGAIGVGLIATASELLWDLDEVLRKAKQDANTDQQGTGSSSPVLCGTGAPGCDVHMSPDQLN
jgi:hypothetical protein